MATFKDLKKHVDYLNDKYCKNTKNHLVISRAYGGYAVELTGKTYKRGKKIFYRKNSLRSGVADIGNSYHDTANNTLNGLYKAESKGWLQNTIKNYEKHPRY